MCPSARVWKVVGYSALAYAAMAQLGCAPHAAPPVSPEQEKRILRSAEKGFDEGLAELARHDRRGDWSPASCREVAGVFDAAATKLSRVGQKERALAARYDGAVALARCKLTREARHVLEALVKEAPDFHRAQVQLTVHRLADGELSVEQAIAELERAVREGRFANAEALVHLAILQMRRDSTSADADGDDDLERAHKNLQRALAIDDAYMPAYNQLALYYLAAAKRNATRADGKVDTAALELAALVCSQAIRKDASHAAIFNTSGLVSAQLGDSSAAALAFDRARKLDPRFVEAHVNYAAINLRFRGFANAQQAYARAKQLAPDDYEVRLGLALAIRGQIAQGNREALLAAVQKELDAAKKIDASRPEAYFNEAILIQEFRASAAADPKPLYRKAQSLYDEFINKAATRDDLAPVVHRARERKEDIGQILTFLGQDH